ncbi:MAG: cisplatin damage response ATP-dependent DNA ligase, partial [Pseudomonadota bacterium]
MERFAELLDSLVYTQSRNRKLELLGAYFATTPDQDRGWALCALTDGLPLRFPLRRVLGDLLVDIIDPDLYRLSRDYVGDTAETVSLLWPDYPGTRQPPALSDVVSSFQSCSPMMQASLLRRMLDNLDTSGRFALLKLLGGAPRVGVSARMAKMSLAKAFATDIAEIEEVWHAVDAPYGDLFAWLEGRSERPDPGLKPVFRPLMLAHPVEEEDWPHLSANDLLAEWKWDGIRVQIASKPTETRIYSRTGDEITASFPEIASAFTGLDCVADGELLIVREGVVAPFNDLQQRLNRKAVSARMQRDFPAHVRLYDLLLDGQRDLRSLTLVERRQHLEAWFDQHAPTRCDLSDLVTFDDFEELGRIWSRTRADEIEGLMLKQKSSPYLAGRPKGHWWKWKR